MRIITASLVALVIICASAGPSLAGDMAAAKENYAQFCAQCHGVSGGGNGPAAAALQPKPMNFTDCARMAKIPDKTLFTVIRDGTQAANLGNAMPPSKDAFDDSEIHDLVAYVRSFCKH